MRTNEKTKKICTLAMLIAISFILNSIAIRIGAGIKISFKFLSVFLSASLFGPLCGGICGALADILSYFLNPGSGMFMPMITLVEFMYGFMYGIFFYKRGSVTKENIVRLIICVLLNTVVFSIFSMSLFLKDLMGFSYIQMVIYRIPSSFANMLINFICILILLKYIPQLKKLSGVK